MFVYHNRRPYSQAPNPRWPQLHRALPKLPSLRSFLPATDIHMNNKISKLPRFASMQLCAFWLSLSVRMFDMFRISMASVASNIRVIIFHYRADRHGWEPEYRCLCRLAVQSYWTNICFRHWRIEEMMMEGGGEPLSLPISHQQPRTYCPPNPPWFPECFLHYHKIISSSHAHSTKSHFSRFRSDIHVPMA